ncbi:MULTISPECIES: hypothetical protein [Curtobacterium]|uniref:hypothetical protein n=1 Tax=Curtobacterium TaxID=2034 RepID=UPI0015F3A426|nr:MULTISPECIES: hypothetical protein [Curtobacterium]MCS6561831.1 hypothetical protein [Curtobacterium flaccumfaciens pv. poinsettiae]UXN28845.1 hypothetical protein N8D75_00590 [Curtobacterium flaccumfaciens]
MKNQGTGECGGRREKESVPVPNTEIRLGVDIARRRASAVELGERYRFTVGAGSFKLRSGLKILKVAPEIYSYAAVAASEVPRRGSRDSPNDE